jgi:hypothetical protein
MSGRNHDGTYGEPVFDLVESAFSDVHLDRAALDVVGRGRWLRRRKRALPVLGAFGMLAASAGLALALTGPGNPAGANTASTSHSLKVKGSEVNVDNAAFSVHTNAKTGIVTVTVRQFQDEDYFKQVLAEAGIRAIFDAPCTNEPGIKGLNPSGVFIVTLGKPVNGWPPITTYTINPAKMPSGSVLSFEYIKGTSPATTIFGIGLLSRAPTGSCAAH